MIEYTKTIEKYMKLLLIYQTDAFKKIQCINLNYSLTRLNLGGGGKEVNLKQE